VVRQVGSPPARTTLINGVLAVHTSDGSTVPFTDPRVHLLFPSMGKLGAEALAAAFRSVGFNASALPPCDETTLKTGRTLTSCKECLPLILTTGALLTYIRTHQSSGGNRRLLHARWVGTVPLRPVSYFHGQFA
jgi:hypothetical protein